MGWGDWDSDFGGGFDSDSDYSSGGSSSSSSSRYSSSSYSGSSYDRDDFDADDYDRRDIDNGDFDPDDYDPVDYDREDFDSFLYDRSWAIGAGTAAAYGASRLVGSAPKPKPEKFDPKSEEFKKVMAILLLLGYRHWEIDYLQKNYSKQEIEIRARQHSKYSISLALPPDYKETPSPTPSPRVGRDDPNKVYLAEVFEQNPLSFFTLAYMAFLKGMFALAVIAVILSLTTDWVRVPWFGH